MSTCILIHIHTDTHTQACIHTRTLAHMQTHMHKYIHTYMRAYMHTYIYIYITRCCKCALHVLSLLEPDGLLAEMSSAAA